MRVCRCVIKLHCPTLELMAAETFEQYGIYGDAPESTYRLLHQHEFDENETTERLAYPNDSLATEDFEDLLTQVCDSLVNV